jgi:hypothetical protein
VDGEPPWTSHFMMPMKTPLNYGTSVLIWPIEGDPMTIQDRTITVLQWGAHWALIPPVALLLVGWLFLWVGNLFLRVLRIGLGKWRTS